MKTYVHLLYYFPQFFLEWETFQTEFVEKTELRILYSLIFFLNPVVYEIMWKNVVEPGRTQMAIWPMRVAYWTPKATGTCSEYIVLTALLLLECLHKRASMIMFRIYCLSCSFWYCSWKEEWLLLCTQLPFQCLCNKDRTCLPRGTARLP